jgi:hypothetical protein
MKKINFTMEYKQNKEKNSKKYELESNELPTGDELPKLIIYEYISKNNLSEEEKIKLALKYQLFIEGTSLFAEIELSEKNTEKIIEYKEVKTEDNLTEDIDENFDDIELCLENMENSVNNIKNEIKVKLKNKDTEGAKRLAVKQVKITEQIQRLEGVLAMMEEKKMMLENTTAMKDVMSIIKQGNMAIKESSNYLSVEDLEEKKIKYKM